LGKGWRERPLAQAVALGAKALTEVETRIKQGLQRAAIGHFDETGMYVQGRRQWLHVASTESLTHYACHPKRGRDATEHIGILPMFTGRAMHDGLRSYLAYTCAHALCNAHHLRELTFLEEQLEQAWAGKMKALLRQIYQTVVQTQARGGTHLTARQRAAFEHRYDAILNEGFAVEAARPPLPTGQRGRKKQSKAKNLLDRLSAFRRETLAFMDDFRVPFDNNLAERHLRMMKVQQKISGCFRTDDGATAFCRIRSYISTMRKQGHNVFTLLKSVFAGHPIAPALSG
jgi:transposase